MKKSFLSMALGAALGAALALGGGCGKSETAGPAAGAGPSPTPAIRGAWTTASIHVEYTPPSCCGFPDGELVARNDGTYVLTPVAGPAKSGKLLGNDFDALNGVASEYPTENLSGARICRTDLATIPELGAERITLAFNDGTSAEIESFTRSEGACFLGDQSRAERLGAAMNLIWQRYAGS